MVNRLISLAILICIFWGIYGFYYYFFVINKWELTLISNVENYKVVLYNKNLMVPFSTECESKKCELIDIAPFEYEMTITKEGYKDIQKNIRVLARQKSEEAFILQKQLYVEPVIQKEEKQWESETQIQHIREIAELQKTYKFFQIPNLWYFYFQQNDDKTLTLFHKNGEEIKKLYSFSQIERAKINITQIFQTSNMISIQYADDVYLYNLSKNTIEKVYFPQGIDYIKKSKNEYHFVNQKWTFLYDSNTKKIEYFYIFKDFIYYDNEHYLWVIFSSETEKKRNYNLSLLEGNLIVKYNFKTKNIKVLETTPIAVSQIILEKQKVYFYDAEGNKYAVSNIE